MLFGFGNRGGRKAKVRAGDITAPVPSVAGVVYTLPSFGLAGPVNFAKTGGDSNLTVGAATGVIAAALAISEGESETISGTALGSDGCLIPWSATFSVPVPTPTPTPTPTLPGAPTILDITPGDGEATIHISPGAPGAYPVTAHQLYGKASSGVGEADAIGAPFAGFVTTATDLPDGGAYYFRAAAIDSMGNVGPLSEEASVIIGLTVTWSAETDAFTISNAPVGATIAWYHADGTLISGEAGTILAGSNVPGGGIVYAVVDGITSNLAARVPEGQDELFAVDFTALPDDTFLAGVSQTNSVYNGALKGPFVELPGGGPAFKHVGYLTLQTDGTDYFSNYRVQGGKLRRTYGDSGGDNSGKLYQGPLPPERGYQPLWRINFDDLTDDTCYPMIAIAEIDAVNQYSPARGLYALIGRSNVFIFSSRGGNVEFQFGESHAGTKDVVFHVDFDAQMLRFFVNGVEQQNNNGYVRGEGYSLSTLYGEVMNYADGWRPGYSQIVSSGGHLQPRLDFNAGEAFSLSTISDADVSGPVFTGYLVYSDRIELTGSVTYSGAIGAIRHVLTKPNGQVLGVAALATNGDGTADFAIPIPLNSAGLSGLVWQGAPTTALDSPAVFAAPDVPSTIPAGVLEKAKFGINMDGIAVNGGELTNAAHMFAFGISGASTITPEGIPTDLAGGSIGFTSDFTWPPEGSSFYGDYNIKFTNANRMAFTAGGDAKISITSYDRATGTATATFIYTENNGDTWFNFTQVPPNEEDFLFTIKKVGLSDADKDRVYSATARAYNSAYQILRFMGFLGCNYSDQQSRITVTEIYPDDVLTIRGAGPNDNKVQTYHHFAPPLNILTDQAVHEGKIPYVNMPARWAPNVNRLTRDHLLATTSLSYVGLSNEEWNSKFSQYFRLNTGRAVLDVSNANTDVVEGDYIKGRNSGILKMALKLRIKTGRTQDGDGEGWLALLDHGPFNAPTFEDGEPLDLCAANGDLITANVATFNAVDVPGHIRHARLWSCWVATVLEPEGAGSKLIPVMEWHDDAAVETYLEMLDEEENWRYCRGFNTAPYGPAVLLDRTNVAFIQHSDKEKVFLADKTEWNTIVLNALADGATARVNAFKEKAKALKQYCQSKGLFANQIPLGTYECSPQGESGAGDDNALFALEFVNGGAGGITTEPAATMCARGRLSGFGLIIGDCETSSGSFASGNAQGGLTCRTGQSQPYWSLSRTPIAGEAFDLVTADGELISENWFEAANSHSLFYETTEAFVNLYQTSGLGTIFRNYLEGLASAGAAPHLIFAAATGGPGDMLTNMDRKNGLWDLGVGQENLTQEPEHSVRTFAIEWEAA